MAFTYVVLAKHIDDPFQKPYSWESGKPVNKGDLIKVETRRGEQYVIAVANALLLSEEDAHDLSDALGGYWPLAKVKTRYFADDVWAEQHKNEG